MGQAASALKALSCDSAFKYWLNAMHCSSDCCGGWCSNGQTPVYASPQRRNIVEDCGAKPTSNSYEALKIMRKAWDAVDIFSVTAYRCKWITKISYLLMLRFKTGRISNNIMPKS